MGALNKIINPALVRTRNDTIKDVDTTTAKGQKAVLLYETIVETAIGTYPWPFLTKAVELERIGSTGDDCKDYQYDYRLPPDYWFCWNFYDSIERKPSYDYSWDFSTHYIPFAYPLSGTFDVHGQFGRIIDGRFNSDSTRVYCLYTPRPGEDIRHMGISSWSPQLTEYVRRECMVAYEQAFSQDAETSLPNIGLHEREKKRMKSQSAVENRKAQRIPEAKVLSTIKQWTRW